MTRSRIAAPLAMLALTAITFGAFAAEPPRDADAGTARAVDTEQQTQPDSYGADGAQKAYIAVELQNVRVTSYQLNAE